MAIIPITQLMGQAEVAIAQRQENERKDAAFNALRRTYGNIAGDPRAALQMQEYGFNQQANPMRLAGMETQNALSQQSYDFNEQYNPLRVESAELANEAARAENVDAETEMRRRALIDGARYVKRRMAQGVDIGTAFDEAAPYLPATDEQKVQLRDTLTRNPGELDSFLEAFGQGEGVQAGLQPQYGVDEQGNPVMMQITKDGRAVRTQMPPGVTLAKEPIRVDAGHAIYLLDPQTRQIIGAIPKGGAPSADQSPTSGPVQPPAPGQQPPPGTPPAAPAQAPVQLAPTPGSKLDLERQAAAAQAEEAQLAQEAMAGAVAAPVLRTFNRALDEYIPQFTPGDSTMAASQRAVKSYIPGTAEHKFDVEVITPLSNISLERLRQMRAQSSTGASGLGQVTEAEHKMLQQSLGAVDVTLPPEKLRENIRQLHNTFLDILYGSKKQRERLIQKGALDPELSATIDAQHLSTDYDQFGDRRPEQNDTSDDDLLKIIGGGR